MLKLMNRFSAKVFLIFCILISTLPFLNLRVLRMAGDEKVYISQSIEMARSGHWFLQRLGEEPNYFKGPFHYILTRIGLLVFGNQIIAGVWMNAVFLILIGISLYKLAQTFASDDKAALMGAMGAINIGLFTHTLASQMEVELTAFYTFALCSLGLAKTFSKDSLWNSIKVDLPFWIFTGMAGWIKSPAHCVLIGVGGIFYWALSRQLFQRIKSPAFYISALIGVVVCIAGYLPAIILDFENFREAFIMRENVTKPDNNRQWHYVIMPLLHFSVPWILMVLSGFLQFRKTPKQNQKMVMLGLALALPTLLFWATWSYKGQNYNLPAITAIMLFGFALASNNLPRISFQIMGLIGLIALFGLLFFLYHFFPLPGWFKLFPTAMSVLFFLLFSVLYLFGSESRTYILGSAFLMIAIGCIVTPFGERELRDARKFLNENPEAEIYYDNIDTSIWNEWGLMQLALHKKIQGIHKESSLSEAIKPGSAIFLNSTESLERAKKAWEESKSKSATTENPAKEPILIIWKRWLTKGRTETGESMLRTAWINSDFSKLERDFYIYYFPK